MRNSNNLKRIEWIDFAKGIGIFLVILGHVSHFPHKLKIVIFAFHMPLFFFLSGITFDYYKYPKFGAYIKRKFVTLIIPYFGYAMLCCIAFLLIGIIDKSIFSFDLSLESLLPYWKMVFLGGRDWTILLGSGPLWFLMGLFSTEVLLYFLIRIARGGKKEIVVLLIAVSTLGVVWNLFCRIQLWWSIDIALVAVGFLGAGYILKDYIIGDRGNKARIMLIILFGAGSVFCAIINAQFTGGKLTSMADSQYSLWPFFYIASFLGIAGVIIFSKVVQRWIPCNFLGRYSIVYLAFHGILNPVVYPTMKTIGLYGKSQAAMSLYGILYACIIVIVITPFVFLIKSYAPMLLGRRKNV